MELNEKTFFNAGELVKIKQGVDGPTMVVKTVNKAHERGDASKTMLIGVTCFWFTKDNAYQSQMFSTKDLQKVR